MDTIEEVIDYLECDCQYGYVRAVKLLESQLQEAHALMDAVVEARRSCPLDQYIEAIEAMEEYRQGGNS